MKQLNKNFDNQEFKDRIIDWGIKIDGNLPKTY